jgi:DNA-binding response OmpR family regulator
MIAAEMALTGKRVLIVEDEMLVALLIEDFLADMGCTTVGPFRSVAVALEAARTEDLDLAVLDVNLDGERVYPVAEMLAERRIPFLFLSGYGEEAIPPGHAEWKVCAKPFRSEVLMRMLAALVAPAVS